MKRKAENKIQQDALLFFTNKYCLAHHNPRCLVFSVPNESEDGWQGQKKVNTGLLSGVADVIVCLPGGVTVFMECKTETGHQSPKQREFQQRANALGFPYYVFRSVEQFMSLLAPHLTASGVSIREVQNG